MNHIGDIVNEGAIDQTGSGYLYIEGSTTFTNIGTIDVETTAATSTGGRPPSPTAARSTSRTAARHHRVDHLHDDGVEPH